MYKRILVTLDGTNRAETILPHVVRLAKCLQMEIILLRVFKIDYGQVDYYGHDPDFYKAISVNYHAEILGYLADVQAKLQEEELVVRVIAEEGPVIETILDVARREAVDIISMASHGRGGLARVIHSSIAEGVLQYADKPLLVIRSEAHLYNNNTEVKDNE